MKLTKKLLHEASIGSEDAVLDWMANIGERTTNISDVVIWVGPNPVGNIAFVSNIPNKSLGDLFAITFPDFKIIGKVNTNFITSEKLGLIKKWIKLNQKAIEDYMKYDEAGIFIDTVKKVHPRYRVIPTSTNPLSSNNHDKLLLKAIKRHRTIFSDNTIQDCFRIVVRHTDGSVFDIRGARFDYAMLKLNDKEYNVEAEQKILIIYPAHHPVLMFYMCDLKYTDVYQLPDKKKRIYDESMYDSVYNMKVIKQNL